MSVYICPYIYIYHGASCFISFCIFPCDSVFEYKVDHISKTKNLKIVKIGAASICFRTLPIFWDNNFSGHFSQLSKKFERPYLK